MKSKFIFIYDDRVHESLQVHHVMFGISERDERSMEKIERAALKNHDIFFKRYDQDVCDFIERLSMQIYPNLSPSAAKAKFFILNEKFSTTPQECLKIISSSSNPYHVKNLML